LKDVAIVVHLHEFAAGGRHGRRFERFTEVCQVLPDRPRFRDERDQPDVAAALRADAKALKRMGLSVSTGNTAGLPIVRTSPTSRSRSLNRSHDARKCMSSCFSARESPAATKKVAIVGLDAVKKVLS
jgi:hypothetical protein